MTNPDAMHDHATSAAELERIAAGKGEQISAATLANARDVLAFCEGTISTPKEIGRGYWPTIRISWPGLEIEVFEERMEIYRFLTDGRFDVWYEEHRPGDTFSERFVAELSAGNANCR